ncbi:hypothetical protein KR044_000581 [Drosophila immigrans]|nr:hypothetical protein KR044_000581 [Drosophila immigrans]
MSWRKVAFLSYFFTLAGISGFYFNVKSGRFIKSRWLCWYSRLLALLLFTWLPFQLYKLWITSPSIITLSKLTLVCIKMFPPSMVALVTSSIYCVHRWQYRILHLVENLLDMDSIEFEPYIFRPSAQHRSQQQLLVFRIILTLLPTLMSMAWIFIGPLYFVFYINQCMARTLVNSVEFLLFLLVWQICQLFLRTQISLEYLLHHPRPMPLQLQKIIHIQRILHRLIYMVNELCTIFKYPLFCCVFYMVNHTCFDAYMLIRATFGEPLMDLSVKFYIYAGLLNTIELLELYSLARVCYTVSKLIESTLTILRYPTSNGSVVERSNDLFGLRLCTQNMNICAFGVCNINPKLFFSIITNIILLVLYMVQSDYNFLNKV